MDESGPIWFYISFFIYVVLANSHAFRFKKKDGKMRLENLISQLYMVHELISLGKTQ